jgi:6,7-dimethyl-8-ribityllumazine synthase
VADENIAIFEVPGAFELPLLLQALANTENFEAAVALGVVIRGETSHFDYVAGEASAGIREVMLKTGLPIGFGLLTTENEEQAEARAGGKVGNKGYDAAVVALEMATLLESIEHTR